VAKQTWSFAEVGYQETKSSALLQQLLRAADFKVKAGVADMPTRSAVILSKRATSTSKIRVASRKELTMHIDVEIPDAPPSPPGGPDVPKSPPAPPTPTDEPPPKPVDDPPAEAEPKPPYTVGVM
jgi:hypothetical protein